MNLLEALQLQLRLEGFEIVSGNRLRQVEVVPDEEMPVMILARLADGQVVPYFDENLQQDLYLALAKQTPHILFPDIAPLNGILKAQNIPLQTGHYRTNLFPDTFLDVVSGEVECRSSADPQVRQLGFGDFAARVYGIARDGKIVSACVSTREDQKCAEAWVSTDPQYRHLGFARQVVSVWARDILAAGKVPFYSHKLENIASAFLARSLGLQPAFEEISISYMNV